MFYLNRIAAVLIAPLSSLLVVSSCSSQQKPAVISPDPVHSSMDKYVNPSGDTITYKSDFFLLKGDVSNKKQIEDQISNFLSKEKKRAV